MHLCKYLSAEPLRGYYLLVNSLSGAVDFVEKSVYEAIKNLRFEKLTPANIELLQTRGYLFNNQESEQNFLKNLYTRYQKIGEHVVDFVVCPTFDCNLACPYCFQKNLNKRHLYLSKNSLPALIKAINKMSRIFAGEHVVQLFGGEPLLPKNKPFIEELLVFCQSKKYPVAITTNGTNIKTYRTVFKKFNKIIKIVQITIDGPPEIHDKRRVPPSGSPTFDLIIKGIKYLIDQNINVQARVNIDRSNVFSLPELAKILAKNNLLNKRAFRCSLAPVEDHCSKNSSSNLLDEETLLGMVDEMVSRNDEMESFSYKRIPKIIRHLHSVLANDYSGPQFSYCEANREGSFIFTPEGLIYACSETAGHPNLAIGSFFPDFTLDENKLSKWNKRTILRLNKCKTCSIAPLCGGGCTYAAYKINGKTDDPYCHNAKKIIKNYIKEKKYELFDLAKRNIA